MTPFLNPVVMALTVMFIAVACTQAPPSPGSVNPTTADPGQATAPVEVLPAKTPVPESREQSSQPPPASLVAEQPTVPRTQSPALAGGSRLDVIIDWTSIKRLFAQHGVDFRPQLEKVTAYSLDGAELATLAPSGALSFDLPTGAAYLLKARTVDGRGLWALTPPLTKATVQNIDLQTTYQAALIYAAEGPEAMSGRELDELKKSADLALFVGADRLVATVMRIIDNALLWGVDYSVTTEVNPANLRAFGGGLDARPSLASLTADPQPDYVPHIYMLNTSGQGKLFLDRILMSEMKADRWAIIVAAENIPPRVHQGLGGLDVIHGGTTLVYGEDKCFRWTGDQCGEFRQVLVTKPLDASSDVVPRELTSAQEFDGAHRPRWSWD